MGTGYTRSPKILKGALVSYQKPVLGVVPNVIVFQYNPTEMTRSLASRTPPADPGNLAVAKQDAQKVKGPPVETLDFTVTLDATDQLAEPAQHPHVVSFGLHPALAALELLLYPPSGQLLNNRTLASAGTVDIEKEEIPMVLLVWGPRRVVPVRLTSFSITEKAYDQTLNPILADVKLGMRVMTYTDLTESHLGYAAYLATQAQKEVLARLNLASSADQILGMLPF